MAPMAYFDASHSISKGRVWSGVIRSSFFRNLFFKFLKAILASSVQSKGLFFDRRLLSGLAMLA
jgi:hypothetical protein